MQKTNGKREITQEQWKSLKSLIETDNLTEFNQIFDIVAGTAFAAEIGMHYETLRVRKKSPRSFNYRETTVIATKIGVTKDLVSKLVNNQIDADLRKKG